MKTNLIKLMLLLIVVAGVGCAATDADNFMRGMFGGFGSDGNWQPGACSGLSNAGLYQSLNKK